MAGSFDNRLPSHLLGEGQTKWIRENRSQSMQGSSERMSTSNYGPDVQANDNLFNRNADSIPGDVRLDPSEIPRAHGQTGNTRHEDLQRQSVSFSRPRETNHSKYCDLQGRANGDTDTNDASATQRQQSQAHDTDHDSDELVSSSKITTQGHRTRKSSRLSSRQSISQDLALIDWSQEKRSMLLTAASRSRFSRQDDETEKPASFVPRTLEVVLMRRMTSKLNATIRYIDIMILQTIRDDRFVLAIVKDPDDVSDMKNNDYLLRVKLTFNCVPNPANNYMAGYLAEFRARGRLYQFRSKHNEFKVRGVISQCFLTRTV